VADRPAGKKSTSTTGADDVAPPAAVPQDEPADDRADRDRPRAASVHGEPGDERRSVDDDVLDLRERRKSASRKAPGPPDDRVAADDVVIDSTPVTPVGPTEPG
jgi:hypothetical protein